MQGADLSHLAGESVQAKAPTMEEVAGMAGGLMQLIAVTQKLPEDFAGCSLDIKVCNETRRLLAVVMTPVDLVDGMPSIRKS